MLDLNLKACVKINIKDIMKCLLIEQKLKQVLIQNKPKLNITSYSLEFDAN